MKVSPTRFSSREDLVDSPGQKPFVSACFAERERELHFVRVERKGLKKNKRFDRKQEETDSFDSLFQTYSFFPKRSKRNFTERSLSEFLPLLNQIWWSRRPRRPPKAEKWYKDSELFFVESNLTYY